MSRAVRGDRRVKPAGGFELAAWYFMRISGLVLVFLALGHLFIMHIQNNVETISYSFVVDRWTNPKTGFLWRLWDLALVNLAVIHGFNGLRQVAEELVAKATTRVLIRTAIWILAAAFIAMGSYAIVMFQADPVYLERWRESRRRITEVRASSVHSPIAAAPGLVPRAGR